MGQVTSAAVGEHKLSPEECGDNSALLWVRCLLGAATLVAGVLWVGGLAPPDPDERDRGMVAQRDMARRAVQKWNAEGCAGLGGVRERIGWRGVAHQAQCRPFRVRWERKWCSCIWSEECGYKRVVEFLD